MMKMKENDNFLNKQAHDVSEYRESINVTLDAEKKRYIKTINLDEIKETNGYYNDFLKKINKDNVEYAKKQNKWGFFKKILDLL